MSIPWLNLTIKGWVGFPVGLGLDECTGLENIFISIYRNVAEDVISVWQSAVINAVAATMVTVSAGAIATFLTQGTLAYWVALGAYNIGTLLAILAINGIADGGLSQAILYGIGGALIGFVVGLLFTDFVFNWGRSIIMSNMMGTPVQIAAVKATINYFINFGIRAVFAVGLLMTFFNKFFLASNAVLGTTALSLGYLKGL